MTPVPAGLEIRALAAADAEALSSAFAAIGWTKPVSQYERYRQEQQTALRDVRVATVEGTIAGYVTIVWGPTYRPLREAGLPEIQDLNVLPSYRRRRIATRLLDDAEARVAARSDRVGIGVGLHPGYNAAQRLYVLRGYVPDGRGLTWREEPVREGQQVVLDDDLVLHFTKPV